jgi:uncharacterized protein (UPF0333 family)
MASKRASRLFVVVVALLAISTVGHTNLSTDEGGGDHEHKEVKEEKAAAAAAAAESKEAAASESWAGWAQEKLSEGLGMKRDESKSSDCKETATEKKKKQTETDDDDHEKEEVSWQAKEKAKEVYDKAKNKAAETLEAAKHKSHKDEVKDNVAPARGDQVLEEL